MVSVWHLQHLARFKKAHQKQILEDLLFPS